MSDDMSAGTSFGADGSETVDINVAMSEIWTVSLLGGDELEEAEAGLRDLLAGKVDDPAAVAEASVGEFMGRVGVGGTPIMLASFREEMDDGSILGASMIVAKNELGGSLDPWREAYSDSVDVIVDEQESVRTFEQTIVSVPDVFDAPLTVCTWRYLVPFDETSILMFTFSTPNDELADELLEHFDEIMADVRIAPT